MKRHTKHLQLVTYAHRTPLLHPCTFFLLVSLNLEIWIGERDIANHLCGRGELRTRGDIQHSSCTASIRSSETRLQETQADNLEISRIAGAE